MREQTLEAALHLYVLGYNIIPVWPGKKNPYLSEWRTRQDCRLNRVELRSLFARKSLDPAILCGELEETKTNVVGLDFDTSEEFERWPGPEFNQVVRSPRGVHGYAQLPLGVRWLNSVKIGGRPIDIRHHGGMLKCPPGVSDKGVPYEWLRGPVPAKELVMLNSKLFEQLAGVAAPRGQGEDVAASNPGTGCACAQVRTAVSQAQACNDSVAQLTSLERRLLERLPPSVEGLNGSRACIIAGLKILTLTGGNISRSWELLLLYNRTRCQPPWDEVKLKGPDSLPRKLSESLRIWLRDRSQPR